MPLAPALRIVLYDSIGTQPLDAGDRYAVISSPLERGCSVTRSAPDRPVSPADKALAGRQKCLVKLASAGDIAAEVLMSLPSPEEIARRAEEAQAKAQAALADR